MTNGLLTILGDEKVNKSCIFLHEDITNNTDKGWDLLGDL